MSPDAPDQAPQPAQILAQKWWWPLTAGALTGLSLRLVYLGSPDEAYSAMMGSFVLLVPMLVGAVTVYVAERTARRTWGYYFTAAAVANLLFVAGTLAIMIEGLICAIVVLPLFALLGGIGGLVMGGVCRWSNWPRRAAYSFAALPLLLGGFEQNIRLPQDVETVTRIRVVAATPDEVWPHLVSARSIRPHEIGHAWMYRIGVPLPESAIGESAADGLVRHITMGKGIRFDQLADDWEAGRRVRWRYRFSPDSFPPRALDDHVRIGGKYFDLIDTEYTLEPESGGTVLRVSMRYRVSTRFNWYAKPLAALLVGNFEEAALDFYARRAEAKAQSAAQPEDG